LGLGAVNPAPWAVAGLRFYLGRKIPNQFHGWWYRCDDEAAVRDGSLPLLFLPNHSSWWDGFFGLELAAALGHTFHVMMQADQLAAIPFFRRCGAFPLDRSDPRRAYRDLRAAVPLLQPGHGMWVFPQGKRLPADAPLALEAGVTRLIAWGGPVRVVPVAFAYRFVSEELPEAFAWLGTPWVAEGDEPLARIQAALQDVRDRLGAALATTEREGFTPLIRGRASVNKRGGRNG